MLTKKEIKNIKIYLTELSSRSVGVPEFLDLVKGNPDLLSYLGFKNIKELQNHIDECGYDDFNDLRKEASQYMQEKLNTIENEKEEILRTSEELNIDYDTLLNAFKKSKEIELDTKDEKVSLVTELQQRLERLRPEKQMEKEGSIAENLNKQLKYRAMPIPITVV